MSEEQLAEIVIFWLQEHKWEVYQEVPVGGGIADIVAVQGPLRWIIETKLSMSLQLLTQVDNRTRYANLVSVAIPARTRKDVPRRLLQAIGVGLLTVYGNMVDERIRPVFLRKTIGIELHEEQKTFAKAGTSRGGHWTPFKETSRNVTGYVASNPGCTMKEMLSKIKYHYGSTAAANGCIVRWIEEGVIKGIRIDRSEKVLKLYPTEEK